MQKNRNNEEYTHTHTYIYVYRYKHIYIYEYIHTYKYIHTHIFICIHIRYDEIFTMMANIMSIKDQNPGIELLKNKQLNSAKESLNNRNRVPETKTSVILRKSRS